MTIKPQEKHFPYDVAMRAFFAETIVNEISYEPATEDTDAAWEFKTAKLELLFGIQLGMDNSYCPLQYTFNEEGMMDGCVFHQIFSTMGEAMTSLRKIIKDATLASRKFKIEEM